VVHGVHIIPAFGFGHTGELLGPSQAHRQKDGEADTDWRYYYVNMYTPGFLLLTIRSQDTEF
jgi:hypothetical protein